MVFISTVSVLFDHYMALRFTMCGCNKFCPLNWRIAFGNGILEQERAKALEERKWNRREYLNFLKSCDFIAVLFSSFSIFYGPMTRFY